MHDLAPAHQRAGEDLREEADVKGVANEVVARRAPGPKIDEIHDVVEGEKRDAERQRDLEPRRLEARDQGREIGEEVEILEEAEDEEIAGERERDQDRGPRLAERLRDQPVDQDRGCQQRYEAPVPIAVEEEGQERERGKPPLRPEALDRPMQQERRGQENEEEGEGVEKHGKDRAAGAGARSCG